MPQGRSCCKRRSGKALATAFPAAAAVLWAALAGGSAAGAQPVTVPRFDFSFSNPGARSLGFAGAFAALADDATAGYANPAGLVQLTEVEVSLEGRLWSRSPSFLSGGRVNGQPTGIGIDDRPGLVFDRDQSEDLGLSFASVVVPRGRWSFAVYGHQLARFEQQAVSQGFFFEDEETLATGRFPATRESVDLEITSLGLAAGWRFNDRLSLGLGVVFSEASLATLTDAFLPDDDSAQGLFEPVSFLASRRLSTSTVSAEGTDVSLSAGLLWRFSDRLSAGMVYRQGARFDADATFELGPALPFEGSFRNAARFAVPDLAGAGVAYRSRGGRLTVAAEVDRVGYEGLIRIADSEELIVEGREYRDAWEAHLGAEYALLARSPIVAFRAGYWLESNGQDLLDEELSHVTAGVGVAARRMQVDFAADFSEEIDTLSLSLIYRF